MKNSLNFKFLKQLTEIYDVKSINTIFYDLINLLKVYLNLDVINKSVKIHVVDESIKHIKSGIRYDYAVNSIIKNGVYHIYFCKKFLKFFPFILLQHSYLVFVPNNLKETKFIDFAINQFVEFDLQEFPMIDEWKLFTREKYLNYEFLSNQAEKFRYAKFFELDECNSARSPKRFFFEYLRRYSKINFDKDLQYLNEKIYKEFLFKTSKTLHKNEVVETLRILTYIFYRVKNCDTLQLYYRYFKIFKNE